MKLIFSSFLLFFATCCLSAQSISVGGGIPYNVELDRLGLNARGYYNIGKHFCFGPEYSIFLPKRETIGDENKKVLVSEVNLNAHFIFEINELLAFYPLVGLNYTREFEKVTYLSDGRMESKGYNFYGANLGAGFHVALPKFVPFFEYEYVIGDLEEHIFIVGLFFNLSEENEH